MIEEELYLTKIKISKKKTTAPAFNKNRPIKVAKETEIEEILYHSHSDLLAGHFSIEETYRRIKIRYYWPQLFETKIQRN
jgi:hypothetical protein